MRSRHILATTAAGEAAPTVAATSLAEAPADESLRASDRRSPLQKVSGVGTALTCCAGMSGPLHNAIHRSREKIAKCVKTRSI